MLLGYKTDNNAMCVTIYEQVNGIWNVRKSINLSSTSTVKTINGYGYITPDMSKYYGNLTINLNTGAYTSGLINVVYRGKDVLITHDYKGTDGYIYYLFDPMTGERKKLFSYATPEYKTIAYNPDSNIITCVLPSGNVMRTMYSGKQAEVKYLLSFDGKKTWNAYSDGRWIVASENNQPSHDELINFGMSVYEVNKLTPSDMSKLYFDGNDILTVDVAIYMHSNSNKVSPYIKRMTVSCYDKLEESAAYSKNIKVFDKGEYRRIESLFPIEDFRQNAECYYLLYLGNDWLYTYSDGHFVKVIETADELLKDIDESWVVYKQYGMTAAQVRNIPADMLTDLLANPNYANSEFGLIYVIKSDEGIDKCIVDIHIKGYSEYLNNDDVVIEIVLNGNDKKVISSEEFSTETIEKLLTWIQMRQNGSGEIFYNLKSQVKQYLINYYMISSINIYSQEEYDKMLSIE